MFVTIEGPEGGGKSTLLSALAERIRATGRSVLSTREPGDGPVGERIRRILLDGDFLEPRTELFLFLADRSDHVAGTIRPALEQGKVVLCDRYADSTIVYQGYGRGLPIQLLRDYNAFATGGLAPDLTILLDLDPAVGLARLSSNDRLDSEPLEFHRRVRDGFLTEAAREKQRWVVLDAQASREEVVQGAWTLLKSRIAESRAESR